MRKVRSFGFVFIATITLQSCVVTSGKTPEERIQNAIMRQCDFLPTFASIAALLGIPHAGTAKEIIDKVCEAVDKARGKAEKEEGAITLLSARIPTEIPKGTSLTLKVDGQSVTGLTTK